MKTLILAACLVPAAAAQVPGGYLVVAEDVAGPALTIVEPGKALRTPIFAPPARTRFDPRTVAIDPLEPDRLFIPYAPPVVSGPAIADLRLLGSTIAAIGLVQFRTPLGVGRRYLSLGRDRLLLVIDSNTVGGLWEADVITGAMTQRLSLPSATDVTVLGTKAYVCDGGTQPRSQIVEVDLQTNASRVIGTYPRLNALTTFAGALLGGADTGSVLAIDPVSGGSSQLVRASGAIVAMGTDARTDLPYFATAGAVYSLAGFPSPAYASPGSILDFDVGPRDTASVLVYGRGCTSSTGAAPAFELSGVPALGNAAFALSVAAGVANAPATLVLGASRELLRGSVPLPFDLGAVGMQGCMLLTDSVWGVGTALDAQGRGSAPLPVPPVPALAGAHLTAQWFVVDPGANSLGVVASDGAELILH